MERHFNIYCKLTEFIIITNIEAIASYNNILYYYIFNTLTGITSNSSDGSLILTLKFEKNNI